MEKITETSVDFLSTNWLRYYQPISGLHCWFCVSQWARSISRQQMAIRPSGWARSEAGGPHYKSARVNCICCSSASSQRGCCCWGYTSKPKKGRSETYTSTQDITISTVDSGDIYWGSNWKEQTHPKSVHKLTVLERLQLFGEVTFSGKHLRNNIYSDTIIVGH